jgi:hypothetical protein
MARHERLRERLAALEARGRCRRAEDRDARVAQPVGEPGDERIFRTDDDEVDRLRARERHDGGDVARGHLGYAACDSTHGIAAGCGEQLGDEGALGDLPRERVLASASADEENLQSLSPHAPLDGLRSPSARCAKLASAGSGACP